MPLPRTELDKDELHERTPYGLPGVRAVLNFKKVTERDLGLLPVTSSPDAPRYHFVETHTAEIQLIVADVTPYEAILKFHTTVVIRAPTNSINYQL
ncbi:hypothetical protein EXIGLDRAFT_784838 [Exidia glandulosa HHB12029]|uniref:Uncharacterized protein n=1 Tax=Exidia glandulosa HHB12029 TaxID=1314781 RepID=A0A166M9F5_EXIGL|nr:hypothetical protein EXIGLDRAFT_784838 [Exidia glandulosa HHB12029]